MSLFFKLLFVLFLAVLLIVVAATPTALAANTQPEKTSVALTQHSIGKPQEI